MKITCLRVAMGALFLTAGGQLGLCMAQSGTAVKKPQTVTRHPAAKPGTKATTKTATKPKPRTITGTRPGKVATKRTPALPPTGSAVSPLEAKAALDFHNAKRAEAGVPALKWSSQLATTAQAWANHLAKDLQCKLQHTPNNPYGENIFGGGGKAYTAMDASQAWYSEKPKYGGGALTTGNFSSAGHYTQMMWGTTTQVGIGIGSCSGSLVIVAEYSPHGNILGQKPY
jgi:pathogenesis-related protein 1